MQHNSKTLGDIGELEAQLWFTRKGYTVSVPVGDNAAYDLIVEKEGVLKRVQVKSRNQKCGTLRVEFKSSMRGYTKHYTEADLDLFFVYEIGSGRKALLKWQDIAGRKEMHLTMDNTFKNYEV